MERLKKNSFLFVIPLVALVFYVSVWDYVDMVRADLPDYVNTANDIRDGKIDHLNVRTPGFPILLILTGSVEKPSMTLFYWQLAMYLVSVLAMAYMLYEFKLPKISIIFFSFIALLPYNIGMITSASTELLTTFSLVLCIYFWFLWLTKRNLVFAILSTIFGGYAAITRPTYQLLFFIFLFIFITLFPLIKQYRKFFFKFLVIFGIGSFMIIGSLIYTNNQKFGYKGLTPLFGFNLSTKTVPVIDFIPDSEFEIKQVLLKYRNDDLLNESSHKAYNFIWGAIPELKETTQLDMAELSNKMKDINLDLIIKKPMSYAREVGHSTASFWLPYKEKDSTFEMGSLEIIFSFIHFVLMGVYFLLLISLVGYIVSNFFIKGSYTLFDEGDVLFLIVNSVMVVIVFYTMLISTFIESGNPRFRTPTDLFILFSIFSMYNFYKSKRINFQKR